MKTREGFVSNSSTTSFICGVCHGVEAYSDSCSLDDLDACHCGDCGKTFHNSCLPKTSKTSITEQGMMDYLLKFWESDESYKTEKETFLEELEEVKDSPGDRKILIEEWYQNWHDADEDSLANCPVCSLVSIENEYLLKYLLVKSGLTREKIKEEIQDKYKTYSAMKKANSKWPKK